MHTPSTRVLSALAYDRGEEFDPGMPVASDLLEALSLVEHAVPVIGDPGPLELARERARAYRQRKAVPAWFSVDDLIVAPWEAGERRFV